MLNYISVSDMKTSQEIILMEAEIVRVLIEASQRLSKFTSKSVEE